MRNVLVIALVLMALTGLGASAGRFEPPSLVKAFIDVQYGKAGDTPLLLDIVEPGIRTSDKPLPLVVWIHGGGWRGGDKSNNPADWMADKGYVVASIDYRLSDAATFPAQIYDCKAAIRFLRANAKRYGIDSKRIGVWGGSAGGHLVALLGTSGGVKELEGNCGSPGYSSRVQAVCDFFGPADLTVIGSVTRLAPNPVAQLLGGPVAEKRELAKQASPVTYVSKDDPPFLIVHGDKDQLVRSLRAKSCIPR